MKISYNWLKHYIDTTNTPEELSEILTDCGLEVESIEPFESVKGGLHNIVVGEVKSKQVHPNADRLNLTTVDIGSGTELHIVCGAANVAVGQKVLVATIGATLYPMSGEPFTIKESKIRGELSQGMICAEDELGLGHSHEGIMVLQENTPVGMAAASYFKIENDVVFEIGLTPNRADAMSHIGVARDIAAVLNKNAANENSGILKFPDVKSFKAEKNDLNIPVEITDPGCTRYSGITISGITVQDSPDWLKNALRAIGLKPINNIVDVTNFVLHECGQPLHAFDVDEIEGQKIIVKKLASGTKFTTLDGIERILSGEELMVCNATEGMCIAGIYGGAKSGVKASTKKIFLESACFNAVRIRKASKFHGLKTDSSFRFERGTDPNNTLFALKRAALLIVELSGGSLSSDLYDYYPTPVPDFKVTLNYANTDRLIGYAIERDTIKRIITSIGIKIETETHTHLELLVPPFKTDVQREADVIEEILRIYGYNNIPLTNKIQFSILHAPKPDIHQVKNNICDYLSNNGFYETMALSLTKAVYTEKNTPFFQTDKNVAILNPLSTDLNVLRQSMLFSGLEVLSYNKNRKNTDLKIYEFGQTYLKEGNSFLENKHLSLFLTGKSKPSSWNQPEKMVDFFELKTSVQSILNRLGIKTTTHTSKSISPIFSEALEIKHKERVLVEFGPVHSTLTKQFDLNEPVYFADFNWDALMLLIKKSHTQYSEVPKYPSVRRDLALVVDKNIDYLDLETLAYNTERGLVKEINLFDVYEGDKIPQGKKSYALSFILQDETKTLNDKQIDKIMEKLIANFEKNMNAVIRK